MCTKGSTVLDFKEQILKDMIEQKVEEAHDMAVNRYAHQLSSCDLFTIVLLIDHVTPG